MAFLSGRALAVVGLLLRAFALMLLVAALVVVATDKTYGPFEDGSSSLTFRSYHALRYVLSVAVIGCAYTMLVIPYAAVQVAREKRKIGGTGSSLILIFTDLVFAILIATGAAAGLGRTVEVQRYVKHGSALDSFYRLIDVSCGLMLGAVACMVATMMISVHSLA